MSLTAKDVAEIMRLLEDSSFDELDLEVGELKLSLRRGEGQVALRARREMPAAKAGNGHAPVPSVAPSTDPNAVDVPSPLLGVFYRAPKPGEDPYVEVGCQVEEDTVIAIIEVMKLMNTVRAGVRGTVTEILIADGALAEYGETLMRVRKAG